VIALETLSEVQPDQTVRIALPRAVKPGPHRLVVVIDESPVSPEATRQPNGPLRLRKLRLPGWPKDALFRREEIYGDDGR
jgi:hypothetical protein